MIEQKRPVCSCLADYFGSPPHCRPQCVIDADCSYNEGCVNNRCQNPCLNNPCGYNSECRVQNHVAVCQCLEGYRGDAFAECIKVIVHDHKNPCDNNPCAANSQCTMIDNEKYSCSCIPPYRGDPYNTGCKPECVSSSECPSHLNCINFFCRDPCPGLCGRNALCEVNNHIVTCVCEQGMVGNPFENCQRELIPEKRVDPCEKNPCGPNALCQNRDGRPVCSCLPDAINAPPNCRFECLVHSDCKSNEACIGKKCQDPCAKNNACGRNAECRAHNHNVFCHCLPTFIGDPFVGCTKERK